MVMGRGGTYEIREIREMQCNQAYEHMNICRVHFFHFVDTPLKYCPSILGGVINQSHCAEHIY